MKILFCYLPCSCLSFLVCLIENMSYMSNTCCWSTTLGNDALRLTCTISIVNASMSKANNRTTFHKKCLALNGHNCFMLASLHGRDKESRDIDGLVSHIFASSICLMGCRTGRRQRGYCSVCDGRQADIYNDQKTLQRQFGLYY